MEGYLPPPTVRQRGVKRGKMIYSHSISRWDGVNCIIDSHLLSWNDPVHNIYLTETQKDFPNVELHLLLNHVNTHAVVVYNNWNAQNDWCIFVIDNLCPSRSADLGMYALQNIETRLAATVLPSETQESVFSPSQLVFIECGHWSMSTNGSCYSHSSDTGRLWYWVSNWEPNSRRQPLPTHCWSTESTC